MRSLKYVMVLAVLLAPTLAEAQHSKGRRKTEGRTVYVTRSHTDCCWGNRFSLEPYGGAIKDAYDVSPDGEDTGYLVGFRVGYQLSSRSRLLGNVGYGETDNVGDPQGTLNSPVYDNNWVFTTAGAEFDVVPGRTSASLGLQAGAAFRKTELDGETSASFSAQEVLLPALVLRHRITQRATFSAGLHDYIFDFLEGPAKHSLALTAGIAFR